MKSFLSFCGCLLVGVACVGAFYLAGEYSQSQEGIKWFSKRLAIVQAEKEEAIKIITQAMAENFERRISQSPVDWHMLQRIWIEPVNKPI